MRPPAGEQDETRDHRTEIGQLINLVLGGHDPVARASTIGVFISLTFSMISSCAFYAIEIHKMSASDSDQDSDAWVSLTIALFISVTLAMISACAMYSIQIDKMSADA